jgi:L,D-peptidoglycan transpeptidase YkuD (ErfK/YbiS/YcfS/YnhG family)
MQVRRLVLVGVAFVVTLGGGAFAATYQLGAASVGARPGRDVQFDPDVTCDLTTVAALSTRHPAVRQFIVAETPDFSATTGSVSVAVRAADGRWLCQRSAQAARFGRSGTRPLLERRSGDGTTPAGVFPLGEVTAWDGQVFSMFGNSPDPGVQVSYRDVRVEDCWGATANTSRYQHLVNRPYCPGPDDEWLAGITDAYAHAAVIGANIDPISGDEPGETPYAAAIFLHRFSYSAGVSKPTSGCLSLALADLVATLQLIDPDLSPHFAIGPLDWLRSTA